MNKILVFGLNNKFSKSERKIIGSCRKVLKILKKKNLAIEIYLAGDLEMKRLNMKFRGKNKTANVLSFNEPSNFPRPEFKGLKTVGEIWLNLDDKKMSINSLLIHGLLHLLGYNHGKKNDRMKMEKLEQMVVEKLSNR